MTFTKDAILQRLIAAYSGPGSTDEGTFSGDVLRACADAMAQLWSMEIDGLERRAFVSSAVGDWLSAVCADRGVIRRDGESDEALRARALSLLASLPASGNVGHYAEWCSAVDGILRVKVLPLHRGSGTVDVIAVGVDGKAPDGTLLSETQTVVDAQRPIGADAQVLPAEETPLDIFAAVSLMAGATLSSVQAAFSAALEDYCRSLALLSNTVSYAKLLRLLLDTEGVADVETFTLCGSDESLMLAEIAVPVAGTVTLTEADA